MLKFLLLMLAFLCPMVDEPEEGSEPEETIDDLEVDEGQEEEQTEEVEASETEEEPGEKKPASRGARAIADLRRRTQEAEREAKQAREAVQRFQASQPPPVNRQHEEEEAKLRDANTSELERWQIQSNRALRDSQSQSRQALAQAQDMADKTTYTQKSITNPLYSKYESKVEDRLADIRKSGGNVPREIVLYTLIGKDMAEGKFKAKTSAKPTTVARGKPTGARSDTPSRGGSSTEQQKRTARLLNTQI